MAMEYVETELLRRPNLNKGNVVEEALFAQAIKNMTQEQKMDYLKALES